MNTGTIRYGIDKVLFLSRENIIELRSKIETVGVIKKIDGMLTIKNISKNINDNKNYKLPKLFDNGYRSCIVLSKITNRLLENFASKKIKLGMMYEVELFKDIECENIENSVVEIQKIIKLVHLNYQSKKSFLFDRGNFDQQIKGGVNAKSMEELIEKQYYLYKNLKRKTTYGNLTLYLGDKNFRYVMYARPSKQDGKPVIHQEFRLRGRNIPRLLGVKMSQSVYFDSLNALQSLNAPEIFERIAKKHVKTTEIDLEKFAKNRLGLSNKKKFTEEDIMSIQLFLAHFRSSKKLTITSELIEFFHKNEINYSRFIR